MPIPLIGKLFSRNKQPRFNYNYGFNAGGIIPPDRTTEGFLRAYGEIGWLYAVVFRIALGCGEVKWRLYNGSERSERTQISKNPILTLLDHINPFQTSNEFIELHTIYQDLVGECFWILNYNALGEPAEIWIPYPTKMSVVPDKQKFIKGYIYGIGENAIPFEPNEVIHFKYPNPLNQYRGLGPAQSIGIDLDAEIYSGKWNRNFFYNSARPDGVIEFDYNLSDEQFAKLKEQWSEKYKGVSKAHQVGLLEGGGKYKQIQNTIKDMDFSQLKRLNRDVILGVYGMPLSVMGISENVNKANAEAGDYTFARWIVKPRLDRIKHKLQEQLIPKFRKSDNLEIDYDEVVPETIDQKKELAESGMRAGYLTINEARKLRGLDPLPNGDVLLVPLNLIPTPVGKLSAPIPTPAGEVSNPKAIKGGEGSGNFGHEGRPGEVGGSGEGGGGGGLTGREWANSLNDTQKSSISNWENGFNVDDVRQAQRNGKNTKEGQALENALDADGKYEGTTYRGIGGLDEKSYAKLSNSDTITMDAISSSSKDVEVAKGFMSRHNPESGIMFEIQGKSGVDLAPVISKTHKGEKEVILRKGSKFEVTGKSYISMRHRGKDIKVLKLSLREK